MGIKRFLAILPFALSLGITPVYAQSKSVIIHGRVTDNNHKGIPFAAVQNTNTGTGINSDARGFYILKTTLPAALDAFALGYNIQHKQFNDAPSDSIEIDFELPENAEELQTVTVRANNPPQILKEEVNLTDFEIKDSKLWLVYTVKGGDKIEVTDTGGKHITQSILNYYFKKDSIGQTPHGFLYSIYKDSIQLYSLDSNKIKIKRMLLNTYRQYSGTLVAMRYPYYYYINFDSIGKTRVNYYYFDKSTNKQKIIYRYLDSKLERSNMEIEIQLLLLQSLLAAEDAPNGRAGAENRDDTLVQALGYKPDPETMLQIVKNIYIPRGASLTEIEGAYATAQGLINTSSFGVDETMASLSGMIRRVFSVLRIVNDSVYIFNFDNNILSVYTPSNEYARQVPLGLSKSAIKYRKKNILVDEEKQECYFKYKTVWGYTYLQKINLVTGNVSYTVKLKYPFIDKVCISGGYAYFCYFNTQDKDNIYNGKTCLYKQRLD